MATSPEIQSLKTDDSSSDIESVGIWQYWFFFRKRWPLIAFIAMVFLAGGIFYTKRLPELYRATASINISPGSIRSIGNLQLGPDRNDYMWAQNLLNTQMTILKSRNLAKKVLDTLPDKVCLSFFGAKRSELDPNILSGCVAASPAQDKEKTYSTSCIVYISCTGKNPKDSAYIATRFAEVYIAESKSMSQNNQNSLLQWLNQKTPEIRKEMLEKKEALWQFEKNNREILFSSQEKDGFYADMLYRLKTEVQNVEIQLSHAKIRYDRCRQVRQSEDPKALLALDFVMKDTKIQQFQQKKFEAMNKLDEYKVKYTQKHPQITLLNQSLAKLEIELQKEADSIVTREEQNYLDLQTSKDNLEKMFQEQKTTSLVLKEKYIDYEHIRSEYQSLEKMYSSFLEKIKQLDVTSGYQTENIYMVDEAQAPGSPFYPNRHRNYLMSLLIGILAGIGLAWLLEQLDERLKSHEQIQKAIASPIIGIIPHVSIKKLSVPVARAVEGKQPLGLTEMFRSITTSLLLKDNDEDGFSLVVTSPMPQDGKTTISCNLALTIAKTKNSVLLIDGDMRKPQLHRVFSLSLQTGLADVMQGRSSLQEATQKIDDYLCCITAGNLPENAYDTIRQTDFQKILQDLRKQYRYVLIDASPLGVVDDSLLLSKATDGILFVVSIQHAYGKMLKQLSERLRNLQIPIKGVIVNDTKGDASSQRMNQSYYGHYYGTSYYQASKRQKMCTFDNLTSKEVKIGTECDQETGDPGEKLG